MIDRITSRLDMKQRARGLMRHLTPRAPVPAPSGERDDEG